MILNLFSSNIILSSTFLVILFSAKCTTKTLQFCKQCLTITVMYFLSRQIELLSFIQGVGLTLVILSIRLKSAILAQIWQNMAHLKENIHEFEISSRSIKQVFYKRPRNSIKFKRLFLIAHLRHFSNGAVTHQKVRWYFVF